MCDMLQAMKLHATKAFACDASFKKNAAVMQLN